MANDHHEPYKPKDAIKTGINATLSYGGIGLFAAAVQNAVQRKNVGAMSVFTRFGGTITMFAFTGGIFHFSQVAAANLRRKEDPWNTAIGGFLGGSVIGLRTRRMPVVLGWGTFVAVTLAVFDYTGNSLKGWGQNTGEDEYARKEALRKNRRRPIEETIAELGEGRGIHPPGYEERRRERLRERYGVIVNPVCADPDQATSS